MAKGTVMINSQLDFLAEFFLSFSAAGHQLPILDQCDSLARKNSPHVCWLQLEIVNILTLLPSTVSRPHRRLAQHWRAAPRLAPRLPYGTGYNPVPLHKNAGYARQSLSCLFKILVYITLGYLQGISYQWWHMYLSMVVQRRSGC